MNQYLFNKIFDGFKKKYRSESRQKIVYKNQYQFNSIFKESELQVNCSMKLFHAVKKNHPVTP